MELHTSLTTLLCAARILITVRSSNAVAERISEVATKLGAVPSARPLRMSRRAHASLQFLRVFWHTNKFLFVGRINFFAHKMQT
jgi:hypothetical protein